MLAHLEKPDGGEAVRAGPGERSAARACIADVAAGEVGEDTVEFGGRGEAAEVSQRYSVSVGGSRWGSGALAGRALIMFERKKKRRGRTRVRLNSIFGEFFLCTCGVIGVINGAEVSVRGRPGFWKACGLPECLAVSGVFRRMLSN